MIASNIETPLLNFSVFKHRIFTVTTLTNFVVIMGLYGGMMSLPIFLQNVQGVSLMSLGMVLLPGALVTAVMSSVTGMLYDKIVQNI